MHPLEFEMPGNKAIRRREGDRLVIEQIKKADLTEWRQSLSRSTRSFRISMRKARLPREFDP